MSAPAPPRGQRGYVNLLDIEPEFCAALEAFDAAQARADAVAVTYEIAAGSWNGRLDAGEPAAGAIGALIVDGFVGRLVRVGPQECTELLGSGDIIRPWDSGDDLASIPAQTSWTVYERASLALIDGALVARMCSWPPVVAALTQRMMQRTRTLAFHLAVCHLTRVDHRLLVVLWHFADRWGRVTPDGVALALPLTHDLLARIVGARRPTVTTALADLTKRGLVTRRSGYDWLLHGDPPSDLRDLRVQVSG